MTPSTSEASRRVFVLPRVLVPHTLPIRGFKISFPRQGRKPDWGI